MNKGNEIYDCRLTIVDQQSKIENTPLTVFEF
jgi:hypothetical protein